MSEKGVITVIILILIFAYFSNYYEGFAGSVDAKNAEAIANIASLYNKDNLILTNLTANGNATFPNLTACGYNACAKMSDFGSKIADLDARITKLETNTIKVNDPISINSMMDGNSTNCFITKISGGYFLNSCGGTLDNPNPPNSDSPHGGKFQIVRYKR